MRRQLSFEQLQRNGASGLIKISGDLVRVSANDTSGTARAFASASLTLELQAVDDAALPSGGEAGQVNADMLLSLDEGLSAGYRGYFDCRT